MRYLFIFENGETKKISQDTFKKAIFEIAVYVGICRENNDIFKKSLNGFDDEDISGMIELFNHFCSTWDDKIYEIYEVKKQIWGEIED